jgi:hypothetical protein
MDTGPAGAFSPKVVLALILSGVFAFCAFFVLSAYAPDLRGARGGGANALSTSAVGYAAAVRLLRLTGQDVGVNRAPAARGTYDGLMVLTPDGPLDAQALGRYDAPRLIVLPKWSTAPDPDHPGWAVRVGLAPVAALARFAVGPAGVMTVKRRSGSSGTVQLSGAFKDWPSDGLPSGPVEALQTVSGPKLSPVIVDEQGAAVLAMARDQRTFILADPDLLNTQGLHDPRTAEVAASMLDELRVVGRPILFDVTLNGFGRAYSLLRLALEPPFLGVTLCLAAAAVLIGLQAWNRFGPVRQSERIFALGKTALAANGADMIRLAKREPRMAPRYVRLCRERVARALGGGDLSEDALDAFLDRWGERIGVSERITGLLADAAQVTTVPELTPLARRARRWRLEMTREPD